MENVENVENVNKYYGYLLNWKNRDLVTDEHVAEIKNYLHAKFNLDESPSDMIVSVFNKFVDGDDIEFFISYYPKPHPLNTMSIQRMSKYTMYKDGSIKLM